MTRQLKTSSADIVAAAARVFQAKGYRSSTIDDICLEVGISRPTIYKYVKSKSWLLDQMVEQVTVELGNIQQELLAGPLPPGAKIQALIKLHIESATSKRVYYATVWSEQPELSEQSREAFRAWSHTATQEFAQLITDYLKSEGLEARADTTILANLTLTMLTSLFRWYEPAGTTAPDDLASQILEMLSGALPGIDKIGA